MKGFKVRPEIVKMIHWRDEDKDLGLIKKAIKTVLYMNRLLLKDESLYLSSSNKGE